MSQVEEIAPVLRIGTRGSPLALAQAEEFRARLAAVHPALQPPGAIAIEVIRTTGDRVQDRSLSEIGGKGLFTKEIEEALLAKRIDFAVHSMKDVPTWLPAGLEIGCLLPREDPRDALFAREPGGLAALPPGAVVGTASLRRQAQVLALRPDLRVVTFRGNVGTRLKKLADGEVDATLLALAGLKRLGMPAEPTEVLPVEEMLPAVAQGALGIEIRAEDEQARALLQPLHHAPTEICVLAERACLAELDGSCHTPIAALAELREGETGAQLHLRALLALPDGSVVHRDERSGPASDAAGLGRAAGQHLLAAAGPAFFRATA